MTADKVLQLKISLKGIQPEIWRRFLIESSNTFNQLHTVIQMVMGWGDCHLFEFQIGDEKIASGEEGYNLAEASFRDMHNSPEFIDFLQKQDKGKGLASINAEEMNDILEKIRQKKPKNSFGLKTEISALVTSEKQELGYIYDFGDMWEHSILVEKILEKDPSTKYPLCLGGERACPPEDCGSIGGYYKLLKIRKNKKHPEYKSLIKEWLGEDYDPELFVLDWVNAMLHGKKPVPVWVPKEETDEKDEFVPLNKLLKKDNSKVRQIKSLFEREHEYEHYLGAVELAIAEYFLENRKLKDKDVEDAIKNIKKNYSQNIDFFKTELEKEIMLELSLALEDEGITPHELKLVLDYVLWSVENRTWIPDKQAYVKWLPYFFELYEEDEMVNYKINLIKLSRRLGTPQEEVENMLNLEGPDVSDEQKSMSKVESEFFALDDSKKIDFAVENSLTNPYLVPAYMAELDKKGDFEAVERLCKKMMEAGNNPPMFEFMLGLNYRSLKNPALAKFHMENAINALEKAPPELFPPGEREKMLSDMKEELKGI